MATIHRIEVVDRVLDLAKRLARDTEEVYGLGFEMLIPDGQRGMGPDVSLQIRSNKVDGEMLFWGSESPEIIHVDVFIVMNEGVDTEDYHFDSSQVEHDIQPYWKKVVALHQL